MICHSDSWTSGGILKLSEEQQNIKNYLNKSLISDLIKIFTEHRLFMLADLLLS